MASVLDSYEQQFANLTAEITGFTSRIPLLSGGEKTKLIIQVEKHFDEVNELLEQMDLEIREIPSTERQRHMTRLKSYKIEVSRLEKELKQAKVAFRDVTDTREELLGDDSSIEDQKKRLLDNTESLERQGRKLETGYRLAVETEEIGGAVLNNLFSQRETIRRTKERLRETNSDLGKSSRLLSGMMRRVLQNKLIIYGAGIAVVIITAVMIYVATTR